MSSVRYVSTEQLQAVAERVMERPGRGKKYPRHIRIDPHERDILVGAVAEVGRLRETEGREKR